ncbi:histidine kinase/DNA gyrase B/HSP90-like ATPase [Kribbella pratensis]|uniref:Histidine kinase/DNA gyrase B/HSP90-like ATPase n=1 Tax=Kribbella pratensis TaxID=2512112 RepID=A0ABY2FMY4_9ACTN|nr:histidine kinase/DNA gyrase B/HSP90-like ATPase [Kribbella pratensis]
MHTGRVTTADSDLDRHEAAFHRWAPYFLLGLGSLLALATADQIMPSSREQITACVLVGVALLLQLWWSRSGRLHRGPNAVSVTYYVIRWAIAAVLTMLSGFFAFYVAAGYYDADEVIPGRRRRRLALFACSIPIASAQTGSFPPEGRTGWLAFAGLLVANNALVTVAKHLADQQEARSTARAVTIAELERAHEENAALQAQLLVQAREAGIADERRRLAAEIHDTIAQGLTGIIAQLQVVANSSDPATVKAHVGRATDLARHSLGEARRSVQNLAPAGLSSDGLPEALRKTVDQWSERTGVPAEFTLTGTAQHLHGEFSATVLRITQEALANVSKHAAATRAGVTLSFMDDEVTVDIRDDGKGFDPLALSARTGTGGFGLDGMRARAERIAGSLTVESEPGFGTAVSARIPLVLDV